MTLLEFANEFRFKYDAASNGGPDINSYEMSLCLTQAVRDIIDEAYANYENSEKSKRILAPLLKEHNSSINNLSDDFVLLNCYSVSLPQDLKYVVREEANVSGCKIIMKVEISDLDHLTEYLNNPFKRPNSRKIVRTELNSTAFKIYSELDLLKYNIKYIKNESPIIVINFASDPTLIGDETISGLNIATNTELPEFIHDEIVDKAVIIAIKTVRSNSLQTQVQVK